MPANQDITDELLSLQSVAELQLQRIQKLLSKINPKPKLNKNRPLSQEQVNKALARRIKNTITKS